MRQHALLNKARYLGVYLEVVVSTRERKGKKRPSTMTNAGTWRLATFHVLLKFLPFALNSYDFNHTLVPFAPNTADFQPSFRQQLTPLGFSTLRGIPPAAARRSRARRG
jgi:hypothetical protein